MSDEMNLNNEELEAEVNEEVIEAVENAEEVAETVAEETAETVEEVAEEVAEETDETVEEVAEEVAEENAETVEEETEEAVEAEEAAEATEETNAESEEAVLEEAVKPAVNNKLIGIIAAVVVVLAVALVLVFFGKNIFNKYNRMGYIDTTGRTIGEVADMNGYELADFLAEFELPADMQENTYESVAYYMIPARKVAQMYGMDFAGLKEMLGWDDTITEDTPWGEAEGETTIGAYVGEDNVESFKEQYGLGDEITAETKWKEIRNIVDQQAKDQRIAEEEAMKAAEEEADAPAEEAEGEEAPAEGEAAEGEAAPAEGEEAPAEATAEASN